MHDVLRQRLLRKIESLPDEQIYQVLDYIEFLESKYVTAEGVNSSGLQKFAEGLEDKLRRRSVSPSTIREAFQLISAADRVLSGVSSAGRQILDDLGQALDVDEEGGPPPGDPDAQRIEADPRKRRSSGRTGSGAGGSSGATGGSVGGQRRAGSSRGGASSPGGRRSEDSSSHLQEEGDRRQDAGNPQRHRDGEG